MGYEERGGGGKEKADGLKSSLPTKEAIAITN